MLDPDKREYVVSYLKANVSYDFKMQCFNMAGPSDFSKVLRNNVPGEYERRGMGTHASGVNCGVVEWAKSNVLRWFEHIKRMESEEEACQDSIWE